MLAINRGGLLDTCKTAGARAYLEEAELTFQPSRSSALSLSQRSATLGSEFANDGCLTQAALASFQLCSWRIAARGLFL